MKPQSLKLLIFTVLALFYIGCKKATPGIWKNGQINTDKREEFHQYNNEMFKNLKADDMYHLETMLSKDLIENNYTKVLVEHVSNQLQQTDYTIYDEYYVVKKNAMGDTITNTARRINSYNLYYKEAADEMYIALFTPKNSNNNKMITAVYCKLDAGWKLVELEMGAYKINGQTAPELFRLAKERRDKGYLADAINTMEMMGACIQPSNIMEYRDVEPGLYQKMVDEENEKFKSLIVVKQLPSHPTIFRLTINKTSEGYYPIIYYASTIKLSDTTAIKKENAQLQKVIGKIMPGIDKDKKYLFYSVFNQLPPWQKITHNFRDPVDFFDITEKIN